MKKRFLLDRIALVSCGVSPGSVERTAAVVADFADAGLAVGDGAAVSASEAAHTIVVEPFVKARIGLTNFFIENTAQVGQRIDLGRRTSEALYSS